MTGMETRSQQNRLDQHDEQIQRLQADVHEIKSSLKSMEAEQAKQEEFRSYLLTWVKQQQTKPPPTEFGDASGSDVLTPPPPLFHTPPFTQPPKSGEEIHWAAKKVKLPEFFGYDPRGWISKAELYFEIHGTPPHLRTRLAQLSMTGVAQPDNITFA